MGGAQAKLNGLGKPVSQWRLTKRDTRLTSNWTVIEGTKFTVIYLKSRWQRNSGEPGQLSKTR